MFFQLSEFSTFLRFELKPFLNSQNPLAISPCSKIIWKSCINSLLLLRSCLDLPLILSSSLLCWNWSCQGQRCSSVAKSGGHFWFSWNIGVSWSAFFLKAFGYTWILGLHALLVSWQFFLMALALSALNLECYRALGLPLHLYSLPYSVSGFK